MTLPDTGQIATLLLAVAVVGLPVHRYRRTRLAGERPGDWLARTEAALLTAVAERLRTAGWLSPRLYLWGLFAIGRVVYPVYWFTALLVLTGEAVNLPWSWQRLSSPLPLLGPGLGVLLWLSLPGFLRLMYYAKDQGTRPGGGRLALHWATSVAYGGLALLGLNMALPGSLSLRAPETFAQGLARLENATEADIDRWIENGTLPPGFTANAAPRPAPPEVLAALRQRFAGQVPEPEMQALPGGTFFMGCDPAFEQGMAADTHPAISQVLKDAVACNWPETPRHQETVAAFALGRTEVTFDQWDACVADGGCPHWPEDGGFGRGDRPVVDVSWDDVQVYIAWLNARTGRAYRLPSEAEWEYAARAGTDSAFGSGRCLAWQGANVKEARHAYSDCPQWDGAGRPLPVGSLEANPWGLHDMAGNVAEWVSDCRTPGYAPDQPKCPGSTDRNRRGFRGGSWMDGAEDARSAFRAFARHDARLDRVGFRLALDWPGGQGD